MRKKEHLAQMETRLQSNKQRKHAWPQLLLDKKLTPSVGAIPWLATALKRDLC